MTDKTNLLSESDPSKEVVFPQGVSGFEHLTRYRVLYSDTESGRVYWMESREDPNVCFTLVAPQFYSLDYVLELTDDEEALLQAERPDDIVVLLMLWKDEARDAESQRSLHANIAGPIIINVERRLGMQKHIPSPRIQMSISN